LRDLQAAVAAGTTAERWVEAREVGTAGAPQEEAEEEKEMRQGFRTGPAEAFPVRQRYPHVAAPEHDFLVLAVLHHSSHHAVEALAAI
jgi:hypothetical protein